MPQARRSKSFPTITNSFSTESPTAVAASVYWLPPKSKHDIHLLKRYSIEDGVFDHPVVVLSTNKVKKEALVFVLTSLGGRSLLEYSANLTVRRPYLPVYPATTLDHNIQLFLLSGVEFPKLTYVNIKNPYILSWRHLNPYCEAKSGIQYMFRIDSFSILLAYAESSLASLRQQMPNISSTLPRPITPPPIPPGSNTYNPVNYSSRYNLDIERSGGLSSSDVARYKPSGPRPIPLIYQTQQTLTMNQQTFNPPLSYGTSKQPARNLVRGVSFPQPGPWTSRSPLISSSYRSRTQEPYINLPSNLQDSAASARSRCNLLIVSLFILVIFVTLGYLFLSETKA